MTDPLREAVDFIRVLFLSEPRRKHDGEYDLWLAGMLTAAARAVDALAALPPPRAGDAWPEALGEAIFRAGTGWWEPGSPTALPWAKENQQEFAKWIGQAQDWIAAETVRGAELPGWRDIDPERLARAIDVAGTHQQDDKDWTITRLKYPSELAADILAALAADEGSAT